MFREIELDRRSSNNRLFINDNDDPLLTVFDPDRETAGLPQRAYWLDGGIRRNQAGELKEIYQIVADFIAEHGTFYYEAGSTRTSNSGDGKHYQLATVLLSIYAEIPYEEAERQKPRIRFQEPVQFVSRIDDDAEREFFATHDVIDAGFRKIDSTDHPSPLHSNGMWGKDVNGDTMVSVAHSLFFTGPEKGLHDVLQRLPWSLNENKERGTKQAVVYMRDVGNLSMPAAMWAYYHGRLTPGDRRSVMEQAKRVKKYLSERKLEPDHLTGVQDNNRPWGIAMLHHDVNSALNNRRVLIQYPYFLYTAYDQRLDQCLVKCGVEGTDYERRFIFGNLTDLEEAQRYLQCVIRFKDALPDGYYGRSTDRNLLKYWGTTPTQDNQDGGANRPDNPIPAMLTEDRGTYKRYDGDLFEDLPIIEPAED